MPPALIHRLTHPGDLTASAVVCGDPHAAVGSWRLEDVTCPGCKPLLDPRPELALGSTQGQATRRARQPGERSERALQAAVTEALTRAGWLVYHTHDARHSPAGYPDLTALRGPRLLVAELKSATGTLTPAQQTWLAAWRRILGCEVHVWRPDDLERALEVLR